MDFIIFRFFFFFVGCSNKGESIPRELRLSGVLTLVLVQRLSTCPRNGNCPEYKESSCEILRSPQNQLQSSFTLFVLPKVQSVHSSIILGVFFSSSSFLYAYFPGTSFKRYSLYTLNFLFSELSYMLVQDSFRNANL